MVALRTVLLLIALALQQEYHTISAIKDHSHLENAALMLYPPMMRMVVWFTMWDKTTWADFDRFMSPASAWGENTKKKENQTKKTLEEKK